MLEKGTFNMSEYENQNFIDLVQSPASKKYSFMMFYRENKEDG